MFIFAVPIVVSVIFAILVVVIALDNFPVVLDPCRRFGSSCCSFGSLLTLILEEIKFRLKRVVLVFAYICLLMSLF